MGAFERRVTEQSDVINLLGDDEAVLRKFNFSTVGDVLRKNFSARAEAERAREIFRHGLYTKTEHGERYNVMDGLKAVIDHYRSRLSGQVLSGMESALRCVDTNLFWELFDGGLAENAA